MRPISYGTGLLVSIMLSACSPLKALNFFVPDDGYELERDIAYGELARQHLDVYVPEERAERDPVVVFFYGGRWSSGAKANYRFVGQALSARGIVTVIPDYRLYPQVKFPSFVEDGAAAVRWARAHASAYGGDPDNLFLMGHSAGAHIAALLALDEGYLREVGVDPRTLAGFIGLAGPYNFLPLTAEDLKDMFSPAEPLERSQPIEFVDARTPPMLLMVGLEDDTVKPANTFSLAERVRQCGRAVKVIEYPKRGHVGLLLALAKPLRGLAPVLDDASQFVKRGPVRAQETGRSRCDTKTSGARQQDWRASR